MKKKLIISLKIQLIETESPNLHLITLLTILISLAPFMTDFQVIVNMINVLTSILAAMLLYYLAFLLILSRDLGKVSSYSEEERTPIRRYRKLISDINKLQFIAPMKWISLLYLSISVILGGIVFILLIISQSKVNRLIGGYILAVLSIHVLGATYGYLIGNQISSMLSPTQIHRSKPVSSKSIIKWVSWGLEIFLTISILLWGYITYQNLNNVVAIAVIAGVYFIVFSYLIPYFNKYEASNILKTQVCKLLELVDELRYKSETPQIDEYIQKFLEILAWTSIKRTKKYFWNFYEFQPNSKYEIWLQQQEQPSQNPETLETDTVHLKEKD